MTLPLIIRYVSRSRLWWIVGGMITGAPLLCIFLSHEATNWMTGYVLMPCRADALGWGVAAALIKRTPAVWELILRLRTYLYVAFGGVTAAVVALLFSRFAPFTNELFGLEYSLLALFYLLLLICVLINRKFERVFSMKALCYMGTIAYGVYLLHVPFIGAVGGIAHWIDPRQSGWLALFISIAGIGLATAAAAISWEYLEKPLIKRGHRYRYGKAENVLGNVLTASQSPSTLSL